MKKYKVYGIGAALVDTEIKVEDSDLAAMGVEKGLMTLVDRLPACGISSTAEHSRSSDDGEPCDDGRGGNL